MYLDLFLKPLICFSPDDAGGDQAPAPEGTPDPAPTLDPAPAPEADSTPPTDARWWEDDKFKDHREMLESKGLTVDDKDDVILKLAAAERNAQAKLRKPADQLLVKPGKDESVTDWMKSNAEMFDIPEAPDKYEITKPESWPEGANWDEGMEAQLREIAHAQGMSNGAVSAMAGLYAENIMALDRDAGQQLEAANQAMMSELQKDWGDTTQAKLTLAQQAASVVAEKAGLDATAMENLAATLKPKVGDAGTMRIFAAIGEMMGDDAIVAGQGAGSMGTTPAEARAQLAQMRAPGGDYYEATNARNNAKVKELQPVIDRLTKLAAS